VDACAPSGSLTKFVELFVDLPQASCVGGVGLAL
jgi:hypothetical protein